MLRLLSHISNFQFLRKFFVGLHRSPHILYYHMVRNSKPEYYYQPPINADTLKIQLDWLIDNNYEFVPLSKLDQRPGKRQVAFTTDDGFVENYTVIAPLLADYNIPATFFLINNCLDNKDLMWVSKLVLIENKIGSEAIRKQLHEMLWRRGVRQKFDLNGKRLQQAIPMRWKEEILNEMWVQNELPALTDYLAEHKPYMTQQQITALLDGGFTIGAHSLSHPRCSQLNFEELEHEIIGSINHLNDTFKTPVEFFAYPFSDRPDKENEEKIFAKSAAKAFLGTKNWDGGIDGLVWERDKMEQPLTQSLFWFSYIPVVRKLIFRPLGIYK